MWGLVSVACAVVALVAARVGGAEYKARDEVLVVANTVRHFGSALDAGKARHWC